MKKLFLTLYFSICLVGGYVYSQDWELDPTGIFPASFEYNYFGVGTQEAGDLDYQTRFYDSKGYLSIDIDEKTVYIAEEDATLSFDSVGIYFLSFSDLGDDEQEVEIIYIIKMWKEKLPSSFKIVYINDWDTPVSASLTEFKTVYLFEKEISTLN